MEQIIEVLLILVIKHFVVDFVLQPKWMWANKGTYGHEGGLAHSILHAVASFGCIAVCLQDNIQLVFAACAVEFLLHYHIDWAKMNINSKMGWTAQENPQFWMLLGLDQLAHYLTYVWMIVFIFA